MLEPNLRLASTAVAGFEAATNALARGVHPDRDGPLSLYPGGDRRKAPVGLAAPTSPVGMRPGITGGRGKAFRVGGGVGPSGRADTPASPGEGSSAGAARGSYPRAIFYGGVRGSH